MKKGCYILLLIILLGSWVSHTAICQIKTSATFSNPWIKNAKQVGQNKKEYKKYLKDSLRKFKELEKYYKHKKDSLTRAMDRRAKERAGISYADLNKIQQLRRLKKQYISKEDSVNAIDHGKEHANAEIKKLYQLKKDSVTLVLNQLSQKYGGVSFDEVLDPMGTLKDKTGPWGNQFHYGKDSTGKTQFEINRIDSLLGQQRDYYTDQIPMYEFPDDSLKQLYDVRDSLVLQRLENDLETHASEMIGIDQMQLDKENLLAEQKRLEEYQASFNRYRDKKNLKENMAKLSDAELNDQAETLNTVHESLAKLKKKYVTLPSADDPKSGRKIVSLKGRTFWERISTGGYMSINQREYLEIDMAPSIGYLLHKKWTIGTELVYRAEFGNGKKWYNSFNSNTKGFRLFTDYVVYKSFFTHGEFENMVVNNPNAITSDNGQDRSVLGLMAGIGKTFGLGKNVIGKILIQYNFLHKDTSILYDSPWVVRFGFGIKELKKKSKKL